MPESAHNPQPIVTQDILEAANNVIRHTLDATDHPAVLNGKLGTSGNPARSDSDIAAQTGATAREISDRFALIRAMLLQADRILGTPLATISGRTNLVIAAAAIDNRSGRRRAYTEDTLRALIRLQLAESQHLPIIRAAGYAYPPPDDQTDLDFRAFIADVADHMTRADGPQTAEQILQSTPAWADTFHSSAYLDPNQCINNHAGLLPDSQGRYSPDQPWHRFVSLEHIVSNTIIRVLHREKLPLDIPKLTRHVNQALGGARYARRITQRQIQDAIDGNDSLARNGPYACRLAEWTETPQTIPVPHGARGIAKTIHDHLSEHGPMTGQQIRDAFGRNIPDGNITTGRSPDDLHRRFIRLTDRRIAALPFPASRTRPRQPINVIPDAEPESAPPITTIFESELHWLNRFSARLTPLHHSGILRVTICGSRAAAAVSTRIPIEVTVVIADQIDPDLLDAVSDAAELANQDAPSVRPSITTVSHQEWTDQYERDNRPPYHDVWRHHSLPPPEPSD